VLCEKPFTLTASQARRLIALAAAQRRQLGSASNRFLGTATIRQVKQLLHARLGNPYHATFRHRVQDSGQSWWQDPNQRWRLDSRRAGGGTLQDWGCYDLAVLLDILAPVRVEVVHAWTHRQQTSSAPSGLIRDVEDQVGAVMIFTGRNGTRTTVSYERAAATYGHPEENAEIECRHGAVSWQWRDWDGPGFVTLTTDASGQLAQRQLQVGWGSPSVVHDRPLHHFWAHLAGRPAAAVVGGAAGFEIDCLRAIYHAADSGTTQTVCREDWSS
jgi:predicted dehydrogenase